MKGLAQSVGGAAVIVLGLNTLAYGQSQETELARNYQLAAEDVEAGSTGARSTDNRLLQSLRSRDDDALDVNGTVSFR